MNFKKNDVENIPDQSKSKFPAEVIDLPSKGFFYQEEHPLSGGRIEIKYPTAAEEDILMSKNLIKKGLVFDKFIKSIVITDFDLDTLLLGDKTGIMVASRILAYGNDYVVDVRCPRCQELHSKQHIDLSTLRKKEIDTTDFVKGQDEFDFILPRSQRRIKFKLLTHADARNIESELSGMKKKLGGVYDREVTTRLKHAIVELDGDRDRNKIVQYVDTELLSQDSLALRGEINKVTPDILLDYDFECNSCGVAQEVPVPMDVGFFWPSGRV
jgi:hypothetical protein